MRSASFIASSPDFRRATASPAIAIALLARNSAFGVALAAILFGALSSAGANIQLFSDVPIEIVEILQGAVMIFAVAQFDLGRFGQRAARMIDLFLHAAILMTTPILLAAIGGLVNRIGGLVNLGLESMMLAGALVAVEVSSSTGRAQRLRLVAAGYDRRASSASRCRSSSRGLHANEIIVGPRLQRRRRWPRAFPAEERLRRLRHL